jgi:CPA1 family monovalent cation:H+ antiporter
MEAEILLYIALLLSITAGFAYINHYSLGLPRNSGLLVIAFGLSLLARLSDLAFPGHKVQEFARHLVERYDLSSVLLNGLLGFMLFAGALNVDVRQMFPRKGTIITLATAGVVLSTVLFAVGMRAIFHLVGIEMPLAYCLAFGALISPTDPVTVMEVLKRLHVPPRLQGLIAGESMFNDGIGIVLYSLFVALAIRGGAFEFDLTGQLIAFVREAGGGLALGALTGAIGFAAMRGIDEYNTELVISLALASGTYALALELDVSGPVAVVTAGLIIGSVGVTYAQSERTREYLQTFWSLVDELLNALLFLLIGLEFAVIPLEWRYLPVASLAIALSLVVRIISVAVPSIPLNLASNGKLRAITLLTWSGLRGGISVALALALPPSPFRDPLITACYAIVIFTMIVQGLTLEAVARKLFPASAPVAVPSNKASARS